MNCRISVGANVTAKTRFAVGAILADDGATLKRASVDVALLMTSVSVPRFLTVMVSCLFVPTRTTPNCMFSREIEITPPDPAPLTPILVGEPGALCVNVMVPEIVPAPVGENRTKNFLLLNGGIAPLAGFTENWGLPETTEIISIGFSV